MLEYQYQQMIDSEVSRSTGKTLNAYDCAVCKRATLITVDTAAGVTPMFMSCPVCDGQATSRMYLVHEIFCPIVNGEFYRPTFAEFKKMPDGAEKDHVSRGGLLFTKLDAPSSKEIRLRSHRADGFCILPFDNHFKPIDELCPNKGIIKKTFQADDGNFEAKICLEHAVHYSVFALINRIIDDRAAAFLRRSKFASATRNK